MKKIIPVILLLLCVKIVSAEKIENIFDEMLGYKACYDEDRQISSTKFKCMDFKSMLDLNHSCDTIFIDEQYFDDGNYVIIMWNEKNPNARTFFYNGIADSQYYFYPLNKDYIALVDEWNIEMLKILGQHRDIPLLGIERRGISFHILTRIIKEGEIYSWESVDFWEPILDNKYREDLIKIFKENRTCDN